VTAATAAADAVNFIYLAGTGIGTMQSVMALLTTNEIRVVVAVTMGGCMTL